MTNHKEIDMNDEFEDYNYDNPASSPGSMGLKTIAELELSIPCYSFDTVIVWADEHGRLWWAHDEGCSCPTPFDGFKIGDQIKPLRGLSGYDELRRFTDKTGVDQGERMTFLSKVRNAQYSPMRYAFDREAWEAEKKKAKEDDAIRRGLSDAAQVLGYKVWTIKDGSANLSALVERVPRDINVFQAHVLGTYLVGVSENAIAQAGDAEQ